MKGVTIKSLTSADGRNRIVILLFVIASAAVVPFVIRTDRVPREIANFWVLLLIAPLLTSVLAGIRAVGVFGPRATRRMVGLGRPDSAFVFFGIFFAGTAVLYTPPARHRILADLDLAAVHAGGAAPLVWACALAVLAAVIVTAAVVRLLPKRRSFLRQSTVMWVVITGLSIVIGIELAIQLPRDLDRANREYLPGYENNSNLAILIGVLCVVAAMIMVPRVKALIHGQSRVRPVDSVDEVLGDGDQPIILHLRDFSVDHLPYMGASRTGACLAQVLKDNVRLVGLEAPDGSGAVVSTDTRLHLLATDASWETMVADLMRRARLIVMEPGLSEGTLTEVDRVVRLGALEKTVFLMRPLVELVDSSATASAVRGIGGLGGRAGNKWLERTLMGNARRRHAAWWAELGWRSTSDRLRAAGLEVPAVPPYPGFAMWFGTDRTLRGRRCSTTAELGEVLNAVNKRDTTSFVTFTEQWTVPPPPTTVR